MNERGFFQTFSTEHLLAIGVIFILAGALVLIARSDSYQKYVKPASWALAILGIGHEVIWIVGAMVVGQWHYSWGIPLQLCDLAVFAVAFTLIKHRQWLWEIAYFWGLGGSFQAVLTPDLKVTFPDIIFIKFFLSHGLIVAGVIFLAIGLRRPITIQSVFRVFLITNVYGLCVLLFNKFAGTNYMYLMSKPTQPSLLDYAGDGPAYYLGLEALLVVSLLFYYAPYFILEIKRRNFRRT